MTKDIKENQDEPCAEIHKKFKSDEYPKHHSEQCSSDNLQNTPIVSEVRSSSLAMIDVLLEQAKKHIENGGYVSIIEEPTQYITTSLFRLTFHPIN